MGGGESKILLGDEFFTGWREPEEWLWQFEPFSKLKKLSVNAECQLKPKLTWPKCPKSMKLKQNGTGAMTAAKNAVFIGI